MQRTMKMSPTKRIKVFILICERLQVIHIKVKTRFTVFYVMPLELRLKLRCRSFSDSILAK